jgi:signal transduction histidine kinase
MDEATELRLLDALERLLEGPSENLSVALRAASDVVAGALHADKVDLFLYEEARESLIAVGTSAQPLSAKQKQLGLDVLAIANGGTVVDVFLTGLTRVTGRLDEDPHELRGPKEALAIRSQIGVPLRVGGELRGAVMVASLRHDFFTDEDARFAESIAHWIGVVAHRAELVQQISTAAALEGRRAGAEELITTVAHELRNYVAPLDMRLALLEERARTDGRGGDEGELGKARKALARLLALVTDILDVSRLDHGIFELEVRPVDVGALCAEVAGAMATARHPIDVRTGERPQVVADPSRLRQCVENLVANALKHSPPDAGVTIEVARVRARDGDWVHVEVVDDGPGIPADVLPRIFEPFATSEARSGGLGLGLYLARRVAELHRGALEVDSAPGRGARFVLRLPLADATEITNAHAV